MNRTLIIAIVSLIACTLGLKAQQPISWTVTARMTSETEGVATIRADIESPWHLYGTQLPKGGPQPTSFKFEGSKGIEWTGPLTAKSKIKEEEDAQFGIILKFYEEKAVFTRSFKLDKSDRTDAKIAVEVRFMGCNNETCLPPRTVDLAVDQSKFRKPVKK